VVVSGTVAMASAYVGPTRLASCCACSAPAHARARFLIVLSRRLGLVVAE
jgi:hypothetical protein